MRIPNYSLIASKSETTNFGIGLDIKSMLQQSKYNNVDYTGLSNFEYKRKVQWLIGIESYYRIGEKWYIALGIGIKDVGMKRSNFPPIVEPYVVRMKYNFIYGFVRPSLQRKIIDGTNGELTIILGFEPSWKLNTQEIIYYQNGESTARQPTIRPVKYTTCLLLGCEWRRNLGDNFALGFSYNATTAFPKYEQEIIADILLQHAIGLKFYFIQYED